MSAGRETTRKKWRKRLFRLCFLALVFGLGGFALAEDAPFNGKSQIYTYELGVRPNIIFGVTDTITLTRWAYGWEDGKYKDCTTTNPNSCPAYCGPPVPSWGAPPTKYYCPSYHYGIRRYNQSVNTFNGAAQCVGTFAPLRHLGQYMTSHPLLGAVFTFTHNAAANACDITNTRTGTVRRLPYRNYSGDEWNQATSTIQSALWAMLYMDETINAAPFNQAPWNSKVRGYLQRTDAADDPPRFGNRVRWAMQKTNFRPQDGTPDYDLNPGTTEWYGDWYGPSPEMRDGPIAPPQMTGSFVPPFGAAGAHYWGVFPHDGWGGCMLTETATEPWQAVYSDKLRYLFMGGVINALHGNITEYNYPKTFTPLAEMLLDAAFFYWGFPPYSCYQSRVANSALAHDYQAPAKGRARIDPFDIQDIAGSGNTTGYPAMIGVPVGNPYASARRQDNLSASSYVMANNFYLLLTTDKPLHDNYQPLLHWNYRVDGGDPEGGIMWNLIDDASYTDVNRIVGNHDMSIVGCNKSLSGSPNCDNPSTLTDLDSVEDNMVCAANLVNRPDGTWFRPACESYANWDETLGSNYFDDFAGLLWQLDKITDTPGDYSAADYGVACTAVHPNGRYGDGGIPNRGTNCVRQAITVDVISMTDSNLFRNAALNSMGRYYAVHKPHQNLGAPGDPYYWDPLDPYFPEFGRDCEYASRPGDCYVPHTLARAFNNWFNSLASRNVEIDMAYSLVQPAIAIDPYSPGEPESTAVYVPMFVPTPSTLYEGRLFAYKSTVTGLMDFVSASNSSFQQGGLISSRYNANLIQAGTVAGWGSVVPAVAPRQKSARPLRYRVEDAGSLLTMRPLAGGTFSSMRADRKIYTQSAPGAAFQEVYNVIHNNLSLFELETGNEDIDQKRKQTLVKRIYNGIRSFWEGGDALTSWRLGDTINAKPVVVGPPSPFFTDNVALTAFTGYGGGQEYSKFRQFFGQRRRMVYLATNDGVLHAFRSGVYSGGKYLNEAPYEEWAYIPPGLLPTFKHRVSAWDGGNTAQSYQAGSVSGTWSGGYIGGSWRSGWNFGSWQAGRMGGSTVQARLYGIDATPTIADVWLDLNGDGVKSCPAAGGCEWRTIVFGGLGRGGRAYYSLDVTDPDNPAPIPNARDFSYNSNPATCASDNYGSCYLGYTTSEPAIGRIKVLEPGGNIKEMWIAAFGLGWHSTSDPTFPECPDSTPEPTDLPCYNKFGVPEAATGRGIVILNLTTMSKLYEAYYTPGAGNHKANMLYSVAAGVKLFDADGDGYTDRIFWGDLGGQLWRMKTDGLMKVNGAITNPNTRLNECASYAALAANNDCMFPQRFFAAPEPAAAGAPPSKYGPDKPWHSIWATPAVMPFDQGIDYVGVGTGNKGDLLQSGSLAVPTDGMFFAVRDNWQWLDNDLPAKIGSGTYQLSNATTPTEGVKPVGWYYPLGNIGRGEKAVEKPITFNGHFMFTTFVPDNDLDPGTPFDSSKAGFVTKQRYGRSYIYAIHAPSGHYPYEGIFNCGGTTGISCDPDERRGPYFIEGYSPGLTRVDINYGATADSYIPSQNPQKKPVTLIFAAGSSGTMHIRAPTAAELAGTGPPKEAESKIRSHFRLIYWRSIRP
ncbi:MAG: hypothetical protein Kow0090_17820 [Myxococcota bacterium]